ncbi:MAG: hypothetical protein COA38_20275 [Fluviicola sp.]|nr:MAG: hypothetical protein COA38_20275 [Fluviicola sp.]
MKIRLLLNISLSILILSSCSQDVDLPSDKEALSYKYDGNKLIRILDSVEQIEYFFVDGDINKIEAIFHGDSRNYLVQSQEFLNGGDELKVTYDSEFSNELIIETIRPNKRTIKVYHQVGDSVNRSILVSYLTISNNEDTSNYFYLKKVQEGFKICTDVKDHIFNRMEFDSLVATYTDDIHRIKYYSPEPHFYLPNLSGLETSVITENHFLRTDADSIVGTLWGFYKNKAEYPYSYMIISAFGNLPSRLRKTCDSRILIESETAKNKSLLKKIISSGKYQLEGTKLVSAKER